MIIPVTLPPFFIEWICHQPIELLPEGLVKKRLGAWISQSPNSFRRYDE